MQAVCVKVFIGSIADSNFNGTAFFINENTLVTAKHVVINNENKTYDKVYITEIPGGGYIYIDIIELCDRDIAILKVKRKFNIPRVLLSNIIQEQSNVNILGYFDGDAGIKNYRHLVSGYVHEEHTYELQNYVSKGISGSPVFLDNNICGIAQARNISKNLTYVIPISECCSSFVEEKLRQVKKKHHIFISTTYAENDMIIAKEFSNKLTYLRHSVYFPKRDELFEDLHYELNKCQYFILFLSQEASQSEMVMQEVEQIKKLQNGSTFPVIIPIRINLEIDYNINYTLSKLIYDIEPFMWTIEKDTVRIVKVLNQMILEEREPRKSGRKLKISPTNIPLPNAPLIVEQPTGMVPFDSLYYIQREDDLKCHEYLLSKYSLIRIRAPRQYGKTSLLARLILQAQKEKYSVVLFNFQEFEKSQLNSLSELLEFICEEIAFELGVEINFIEKTLKRLTSKAKATKYIQKILSSIEKPIVLAIDEADRLFDYSEVSDEFFGLIRAWHEKSKINPLWENFKIVLSHSTDPLLGITSINQSPFHNVGLGIELKFFHRKEIQDLASRHKIYFDEGELEKLINFIGGHPFLSRKVLYSMVNDKYTLDEIIENTQSDKSLFNDHMRRYLWILEENKTLLELLKKILNGESCNDDSSCYILEATGLIQNTLNKPRFSCKLYHDFFAKKLL